MAVSRRGFLATVGAGSAGIIISPGIIGRLPYWRGYEALNAQGVAERRADRMLGERPGMIRLDSNENPNGPGQRVFDAITQHLGQSNRYPVKNEDDLSAAIAATHGINAANLVLGCGSGEILRAAVQAFTSPTRAIVSP